MQSHISAVFIHPSIRTQGSFQQCNCIVRCLFCGLGAAIVPIYTSNWIVLVLRCITVCKEGHRTVIIKRNFRNAASNQLCLFGFQIGNAIEVYQRGFRFTGDQIYRISLFGNICNCILGIQKVQFAVIVITAGNCVLVFIQLQYLK